jgi:hypothetical protein
VLSASVSYRLVSENMDRSLKNTADKPQVARDIKYYEDHIGNVKTIDDFFADDRLYKFAMKAMGLSDMTYAKAFMRKVLKEGIDKDDSFANKLADQRYKKFAAALNFTRYGDTATIMSSAGQDMVKNYVRQTLEEDTGEQNEGARLALYFERVAPSLSSVYGILADKAMLKVVQTAFQIPETTSLMDIDKQAEMIGKRLDIKDMKDPAKLKDFLKRFTALYELSNSSGSSNPTNAATTILGQAASFGISGDVLSAIQSLKLGGR